MCIIFKFLCLGQSFEANFLYMLEARKINQLQAVKLWDAASAIID